MCWSDFRKLWYASSADVTLCDSPSMKFAAYSKGKI